MTPEEYRNAYKVHWDAYFTGSNHEETRFRADLIMGVIELVEAANRIADNTHKRNEH